MTIKDDVKKSIGVQVVFDDHHVEDFIGITDSDWCDNFVHFGRKLKHNGGEIVDTVASIRQDTIRAIYDIYNEG